ncbi:MAG: hypothetical protein QOJ19_4001 [Acidimicrobiia bacterium]|nr:hypothetical protein [Acidimicrobiia bacterium]
MRLAYDPRPMTMREEGFPVAPDLQPQGDRTRSDLSAT